MLGYYLEPSEVLAVMSPPLFFACYGSAIILWVLYIYIYLKLTPEGRRPLGRPRCRWVDNIKMDLREIGWDCVDWVDLAQDRDQWRALVNTVLNLRVP
jgi:hypothetical protein